MLGFSFLRGFRVEFRVLGFQVVLFERFGERLSLKRFSLKVVLWCSGPGAPGPAVPVPRGCRVGA